MARDFSCQSGKPYKTKKIAEEANPGATINHCPRCRWYHVSNKRKKARNR